MRALDLAFKNFADILQYRCDSSPNRTAFEFLNDNDTIDVVSYLELQQQAQSIAHEIMKKTKKGDRVLLLYPPSKDFIIAFWACMYAGVIAVPAVLPVKKSSFTKRLQYIIECCSPALCLTDSTTSKLFKFNKISKLFARNLLLKKLFTRLNNLNPLDAHFTINVPQLITNKIASKPQRVSVTCKPDDVMFLQFTSGSTDLPKGVINTHGNVYENVITIKLEFALDESSRVLLWLPPYHDMGLLSIVLSPIFIGYQIRIMSPIKFIRDPLIWLKQITEYRATVSGGPNFSFDLCARYYDENRARDFDLSHLKSMFCGAETIHYNTLKSFTDIYAKHGFKKNAFLPCYGLAESTLYVTGTRNYDVEQAIFVDRHLLNENVVSLVTENDSSLLRLISCGTNPPGQQLKIVDGNHNALPEGKIGNIIVKSPSVAHGYWNSAEETNKYFNYKINNDSHTYLDTGDLGFIHQGHLYVTGRKKEIIIIHGKNHYPQWIEQTIQEVSSTIKKNAVAAFQINEISNDRIIIALEIYPDKINNENEFKQLALSISKTVFAEYDLHTDRILFFAKNSLGKTTSGKIPRKVIATQYYNKELNPLYTWHNYTLNNNTSTAFDLAEFSTLAEIEKVSYLSQHVINLMKISLQTANLNIRPNDVILDHLTDSLQQLDFLSRLENILAIAIKPQILIEHPSINQLSSELCNLLSSAKGRHANIRTIDSLPLLPMQSFAIDKVGTEEFNLGRVFDLPSQITIAELTHATNAMVEKQPYLRTLIDIANKKNIIHSSDMNHKLYHISETEINEADDSLVKAKLSALITTSSKKINIQHGPLFFLIICNLPNNKQKLILVISHFIVDPFSIWLFAANLEKYIYEKQLTDASTHNPINDEINVISNLFADDNLRKQTVNYWKNYDAAKMIATTETWHSQEISNHNYDERVENIIFDQDATQQLETLCLKHNLDQDSLLLSLFLSSFSDVYKQTKYLIQVQHHGRSIPETDNTFTHTIAWMNISWPLMIEINKDTSLLTNIKAIQDDMLHTRKNGYAYNIHYYQKNAAIISPDWPSIEFSNLGKLMNNRAATRHIKDCPLFASDYIHGNTFEPNLKRYRQIFIRPYWLNDCLHMPIFYNKNIISINDIALIKEKIHKLMQTLCESLITC